MGEKSRWKTWQKKTKFDQTRTQSFFFKKTPTEQKNIDMEREAKMAERKRENCMGRKEREREREREREGERIKAKNYWK